MLGRLIHDGCFHGQHKTAVLQELWADVGSRVRANRFISGWFAEPARRACLIEETLLSVFPPSLGLTGLIVLLIGLIILWVVVSIPAWLAAKVVTGGRASIGSAMAATLLGPIVYIVVLFAVDFFLGALIGGGAFIWAFILAFLAWLGVYKAVFGTGWLGALAIAVLAVIVFIILAALLGVIFGAGFPSLLPRLF